MDKDIFKQIGMNIEQILEAQQLTQKQLADALQISKQVMHKIIKGTKAINAYELKMMSAALDVSVDELVADSCGDEQDQAIFGFMGYISNENSRAQFKKLQEAAEQISLLEDLLYG